MAAEGRRRGRSWTASWTVLWTTGNQCPRARAGRLPVGGAGAGRALRGRPGAGLRRRDGRADRALARLNRRLIRLIAERLAPLGDDDARTHWRSGAGCGVPGPSPGLSPGPTSGGFRVHVPVPPRREDRQPPRARPSRSGSWSSQRSSAARATLGTSYDDIVRPSRAPTSQAGQDVLAERFGLTGTNGQLLVTADHGQDHRQGQRRPGRRPGHRDRRPRRRRGGQPARRRLPARLRRREDTRSSRSRFASQNPDGATRSTRSPRPRRPPSGSDLETSIGGDAYKDSAEPSQVPELLGLLVSFLILAHHLRLAPRRRHADPHRADRRRRDAERGRHGLARHRPCPAPRRRSPRCSGWPSASTTRCSSCPAPAHSSARAYSPAESMSRALATAGSAVVFAGATVVIALTGLAVAGIPVLTVMGLAAAAAVTVAVLDRAHPAAGDRAAARRAAAPEAHEATPQAPDGARRPARAQAEVGFADRWVRRRHPRARADHRRRARSLLGLAAMPALEPRPRPPRTTAPRRRALAAAADLRRHHRGLRRGLQRPARR